jgi:hypothetical protein
MVEHFSGAIVPACEDDFGSCERSIDGVPALRKVRLDLVGEYVRFGHAEPSLGPNEWTGATCHDEAEAVYFRAYQSGSDEPEAAA